MMKKYGFLAAFLAMLLLLSSCGAKVPTDDMKWYPTDYADSVIRSFDMSRKPGTCLEEALSVYTSQGEWYQIKWKSGEDAPTIQAKEPSQGGPPPADGLTVAALRKLVEQADNWIWEEKGHDTEYQLSALLYSAEHMSLNSKTEYSIRRDHTGTYSMSTGELTELAQNAEEPEGCVGSVSIDNSKSEVYSGNADLICYYLIYIIP